MAKNLEAKLLQLLLAEYSRAPGAGIPDYYKLLLQAMKGPGHYTSSLEACLFKLQKEVAGLRGDRRFPIFFDISLHCKLVRVNLKAWLGWRFPPEMLARIFYETPGKFPTLTGAQLQWVFQKSFKYLVDPPFNFPSSEVEGFLEQQRKEDFPAIHHTLEYRRLYDPHYRIVLLGDLQAAFYPKEANEYNEPQKTW